MNPYLVLGVPRDADDQAIRRAYLAGLKDATPESNPVQFKALAAAYEQIKDEPSRHRHELFDTTSPGDSPLDVFLSHVQHGPRPAPLSFEAMKEMLRACSKT